MRIFVALAIAACGPAATDADVAPPDAELTGCQPAVGKLTIYAIPPPVALDWSTPNKLLATVQSSQKAAAALLASGDIALTHSIGHVNIQLDCGAESIALTGQTDYGGGEWQAATNGAGLLLRDSAGVMDDMEDGDRGATINDIANRQTSGHVTQISFVVNQSMCHRLKTFVDQYVTKLSYKHYDGAFRARRFEGAGCAIFGAGVIDVGGLLPRSQFTPLWARSEMIGSARIANFLGAASYKYGGNMVAVDANGTHWLWPKGVDVPAPAGTPVWIDSTTLDAWNGPEDAPFAVPGLTGALQTQLPFTIYDPEMMSEWAEKIWATANANGSASALGATWTAGTVGAAHEITYDASCVAPQTIPFDQDNDDLFVDSDK